MSSFGVPSLLELKAEDMEPTEFFVRIRGLPYSATADEIVKFFDDVNIVDGPSGVTFTFTSDGRPSGEAYVQVSSKDDRDTAVRHNKEHMGNRYIEVFESNRVEMEYVVHKSGPNPSSSEDAVLRMRGLPFGCSKEEIVQFFAGYEIVPNGITLTTDHQGRTAGDAYVQFASRSIAERACSEKHKKNIGHRYIELFKSTLQEAQYATGVAPGRPRQVRPGPYDRHAPSGYGGGSGGFSGGGSSYGNSGSGGYGGRGGRFIRKGEERSGSFSGRSTAGDKSHDSFGDDMDRDRDFGGGFVNNFNRGSVGGVRRTDFNGNRQSGGSLSRSPRGANPGSDYKSSTGFSVHMRGLPFSADEQDVAKFFMPLQPVDIVISFSGDGRKNGEADVDFASHDEACEAMKRDKTNMEHRYIELFLNSSSSGRGAPMRNNIPQRSNYGGNSPGPMGGGSMGGGMSGGNMSGMGRMGVNSMSGGSGRMMVGGGDMFNNQSSFGPAYGNQMGNNGYQSFS